MTLPQMSISGAVMIVVIVVIRALAIHKLPKRAFLTLWGVAVARLLIPYSLPSVWSVYSLLSQLVPAAETAEMLPAVPFAPIAPSNAITPLATDSVTETAAVSVDPWVVVWLAGALVCAVFFAMAYFKCRREFQASLPLDKGYARLWLGQHRIRRSIEIRQSDRISAPLTYGVFRPVILMPKTADWEDREALDYVLTHEYVHIRRFDAVWKLTLTAALCVHWFNPAVWMMVVLANRDIELSCDEAVIRRFGEGTKSAYAMTLIRMEEIRSGLTPLCNNFSKNAIEERIIAIMKIKKTSLFTLLAAAALVVGVTAGFATSAKVEDDSSHAAFDITPGAIDTAVQEATVISYVDPVDGKTYYSFDGGITFEALTDEEYAARFPSLDVEWWTYEEFKEWLENEKIELQDMIGERAWTSGRGEFVWTQEIVDETIAIYEGILEDIKNGMLYSKTINEDPDGIVIAMNPTGVEIHAEVDCAKAQSVETTFYTFPELAEEAEETTTTEANAEPEQGTSFAERFKAYAPFGIMYKEAKGASGAGNVYHNGKLVSQFIDENPNGGVFSFTSGGKGGITVKTLYDNNGKLTGVGTIESAKEQKP